MEQRLQEVLLDGEIVRWSGRPSPFKLMSIPSRTSLLLTWVLCSAALAVILGGLIPFFLRTHQAVTDLTVILMIAAFLPAMISIRPLLDKWSLEHDTIYAITNYRVLALVKNNLNTTDVVGVAPEAQLIVMQVFGSRGANWDTILAAMEDCVRLSSFKKSLETLPKGQP